jgi:phytoene dehydrogenase-like protein
MKNDELKLHDYGYGEYIESDPVMHIPFIDGAAITVWRDIDGTCETIARVSKKDANTFRKMVAEYKGYTAARCESSRCLAHPSSGVPFHLTLPGWQIARRGFAASEVRNQ